MKAFLYVWSNLAVKESLRPFLPESIYIVKLMIALMMIPATVINAETGPSAKSMAFISIIHLSFVSIIISYCKVILPNNVIKFNVYSIKIYRIIDYLTKSKLRQRICSKSFEARLQT